jgi:hypothetical protein
MASHDFISILRNRHSFNLTVFGFSINSTFLVNFKQKIKLTISGIILSTDWSFPLILKRPVFTIVNTLVKLTVKPLVTMVVKRPRFTLVLRQLVKPSITMVVKRPMFALIMRLADKVPSWVLEAPPVKFVFSPIVAKFHALWEYDNQTLATLDTMTLADMDYSEVS